MEYEVLGTPEYVDPARYVGLLTPAPVAAWRVKIRVHETGDTRPDEEKEVRSLTVHLRAGETLASKLEDMATGEKASRAAYAVEVAARPALPPPPSPPVLPARVRA